MHIRKKKIVLGIDIGGTKIKVGLVRADGTLVTEPLQMATGTTDPSEKILHRLFLLIEEMLSKCPSAELLGIGLGCTGPLDIENGMILECNNLPTLQNYPLRKAIEERFALNVTMNNDANAMILGEALWGAGKEAQTVLGITLGTGLGCAFVQHKRLWNGATASAGEIWTAPYRDGIIEEYVSGNAISRLYYERTGEKERAPKVADLARKGDVEALLCWEEFRKALVFVLAWVTNMMDPDVLIVGGSVVHSSDLFWEATESSFRQQICPTVARHVQLVPAHFEDNAGFIGAAALLFANDSHKNKYI